MTKKTMKIDHLNHAISPQKSDKNTFFKDMRCLHRLTIPGIFCFTLILIIPNITPSIFNLKTPKEEDDRIEVSYNNWNFSKNIRPKCEINSGNTKVVCTAATISEVQSFFELEMKDRTETMELEISICNDEVPFRNWSSVSINIKKIVISKGQLTTFTNLTFMGLKKLSVLHIFNEVEYNATNLLSSVSSHITYFKFEGQVTFDENDPKNLLAENTYTLQQLDTIEFINNNFADFINEFTFKNAKVLRSLYLKNTKITSIHALAFSNNNKLQLVDLSNNMLINIPGELFISVSINQVILTYNTLTCDCSLKDFIDFYKKNSFKFSASKVKCDSPQLLKEKEISEVELQCNSNKNCICLDPGDDPKNVLTTMITDLGHSTPIPPIDPKQNLVNVTCKGKNCENCDDDSLPHIKIKDADVSFVVTTISNSTVRVTIDKPINNLDILWFNRTVTGKVKIDSNNLHQLRLERGIISTADFKSSCELDFGKAIDINGLNENSSYVFCLIKRNDTEISPFNCQSHYMKLSDEEPTSEEKQIQSDVCEINALILSFIVFGVIIAAVIGAFSMYFLIRYKPTLLKGSPRVVIIHKDGKGIMVGSKTKKKISDGKSSKRTGSGKSVTTQISGSSVLSEVNQHRRLSDSSLITNRSYIVPNLYEAIQYQKKVELDQTEIYFEKFPCSPPPPLPVRSSNLKYDNYEDIYAYPNKQAVYKF